MEKDFQEFIKQLDPEYLDFISQKITNDFAKSNGYPPGAIPQKDFVSFTNYSSRITTLMLLDKYHEWLNS